MCILQAVKTQIMTCWHKILMFGVTVGGWTRRARLGLKEWGEVFRSQPKCLLQEVVCRHGGIPAPLKSGSRYLVTPVGLPWLPSTHIPQPSFTPVPHRNLTKSALRADTHINTGTNKPDRSPLQTFISSYHVFRFTLPFSHRHFADQNWNTTQEFGLRVRFVLPL